MAETILLNVTFANDSDLKVIAQLNQIDQIAQKLKTQKISLGINPAEANAAATLLNAQNALAISNNNLAGAAEKRKTAEAQAQTQTSKTAAATVQATASTEKQAEAIKDLGEQQEKTATATVQAMNKSGKAVEENTQKTQGLVDIWKQFANRITYMVANRILNGIVSSFEEALATMKEVDTELTSIQKVTGASDAAMEKLGDTAYETASKYGVVASEYLESVGAFAKAGYKELAEGLGELATKVQLVGDVDAETANQFLISADAAYKYEGSIDSLSAVLDKANYVENRYATTIEKIAAGLPIVANVAATSGMTIDQLIAALGTITSVTQESGTKAATALRALILNILGDTETEIEEGVTATKESVEDINDILWTYSADVMKAAEATGTLVNPMEAIAGLAKAVKDGIMTDQDLAKLASALGGKLRTNQLLALVNNFDTMQEMLEGMGTAAGSADQEVSVMLDSWESKSAQLSNTWTQFVSNLVNTDAIKGALDVLRGGIELLDTAVGRVATTATAASGAVAIFGSALSSKTIQGTQAVKDLTSAFKALRTNGIISAFNAMSGWGQASIIIGGLVVGVSAFVGIMKLIKGEYKDTAADIAESIETSENEYKNISIEYDDLLKKQEELNAHGEDLNKIEKTRLEYLRAQREEKERQIREERLEYFQQWQRENSGATTIDSGTFIEDGMGGVIPLYLTVEKDEERLKNFKAEIEDINAQIEAGSITEEEAAVKRNELLSEYGEIALQILEFKEQGLWDSLSDEDKEFVELYQDFANSIDGYTVAQEGAAAATQSTAQSLKEFLDSMGESYEHGDKFKETANAYASVMEKIEQGMLGSNEVEDFINKVFSPEYLDTHTIEEAAAELGNAFWPQIFAAKGEDYGLIFRDTLLAQKDELEGLVDFPQNADGTIGTMVEDVDGLAEHLNMSVELLYELMDGWTIWDPNAGGLEQYQKDLEEYEEAIGGYQDKINETPGHVETKFEVVGVAEAIAKVQSLIDKINELQRQYGLTVGPNGELFYVGIQEAATGTKSAPGGPTLVNELGPEIISENGHAYIAGGGRPSVVNLSRGAIVLTAKETKEALANNEKGATIDAAAFAFDAGAGGVPSPKPDKPTMDFDLPSKPSSSSSSSSSSSKSTSTEDAAEALEDELDKILKNLDLQIELANNKGDNEAVVSLTKTAQAKINEYIQKYQDLGFEETSDEILALRNEFYDYADDIADVYDQLEDELQDAAKEAYDAFAEQIDQQTGAIDKEIEALEQVKEEAEDLNELEEKRRAIMEAQEKLLNAQEQRTIRIYNAATGQWEWMASEEEISDAQKELEDAQKEYEDYLLEQQIKALEDLKDSLDDMKDAAKDDLDKLEDSLEDSGRSLDEIIADMIATGSSTDYTGFSSYISALTGTKKEISAVDFLSKIGAIYGTSALPQVPSIISTSGGSDSHDTIYSFGGITLTEQQAQTTTLAELARQLRVLGISN